MAVISATMPRAIPRRKPPAHPDILRATRDYEAWMRRHIEPVAGDLAEKHRLMAEDAFIFLRATYYHWIGSLRHHHPELAAAPVVLGVGDLHVENYGTWRDAEGRLVWGVNDFDEAADLPYVEDLARLATSAVIAAQKHRLEVAPGKACDAILDGYADTLAGGGEPLVLAERNRWLRTAVYGREREPERFWEKMNANPPAENTSAAIRRRLRTALPEGAGTMRVLHRLAGVGSLGRPRFTGVAAWGGSFVAREAKAMLPPAAAWHAGLDDATSRFGELNSRAVRIPDPFVDASPHWLIRRLSPHCCRIHLSQLDGERDETKLMRAMGKELANLHLGTPERRDAILADLAERPDKWLRSVAVNMAEVTQDDTLRWRQGYKA